MTWILTYTGQKFMIDQPTADMVSPLDIAHSLSQQCRFVGHTSSERLDHYSVAEHSLRVAELVPDEHKLAALLHDADEAYTGDISRPYKELLYRYSPQMKIIQQRIWRAICERFKLDPQLPDCVHQADMILLATERRDLMPLHPELWECLDGVDPLPERIYPISQAEAKTRFLTTLMELLNTAHRAKAQEGAA